MAANKHTTNTMLIYNVSLFQRTGG